MQCWHLDAARLDDVAVVAEPQLAPLVTPEGEQAARAGDHCRVLVPALQHHNLQNGSLGCKVNATLFLEKILYLIFLDPELAGSILRKLGLAKCENRSCKVTLNCTVCYF